MHLWKPKIHKEAASINFTPDHIVHFVYGVHDNYTNQMHNGALDCGYFGGKPPPSFCFWFTAPGKNSKCKKTQYPI